MGIWQEDTWVLVRPLNRFVCVFILRFLLPNCFFALKNDIRDVLLRSGLSMSFDLQASWLEIYSNINVRRIQKLHKKSSSFIRDDNKRKYHIDKAQTFIFCQGDMKLLFGFWTNEMHFQLQVPRKSPNQFLLWLINYKTLFDYCCCSIEGHQNGKELKLQAELSSIKIFHCSLIFVFNRRKVQSLRWQNNDWNFYSSHLPEIAVFPLSKCIQIKLKSHAWVCADVRKRKFKSCCHIHSRINLNWHIGIFLCFAQSFLNTDNLCLFW